MKRISYLLTLAVLSAIILQVKAQQVGIGEWRDMLPYDNTIAVEEVGSRMYCATQYSMFYYDRGDLSIQRISKVNGLSDIGVSHMAYNEDQQTLVVAYTNTNIDLLKGSVYINIPDIKRKEILGNKTINRVVNNGNFAYLACGFGIVVLDVEKEEVKDTYYIGNEGAPVQVYDIAFDDQYIYAGTEEGIYYADKDDPNLAFFGNWERFENPPEGFSTYNHVHVFNGDLLINYMNPDDETDQLYVRKNGEWMVFDDEPNNRTKSIRTSDDNKLIVSYNYFVKEYSQDLELTLKIFTYGEGGPAPNDALLSSDGEYYWIADRNRGLVKVWGNGFEREFIMPSGAPTAEIYDMSTGGGHLWVVPGGMSSTWNNIFKTAVAYSFIDETWTEYNPFNTDGLDSLRDMVAVKVDPLDPDHVYTGSWWLGVVEFRDGEKAGIYTSDNSSLNSHELQSYPICKVGGIDFDSENNVWFSNSGGEDILSVRRSNGTPEWESFNLGSSTIGIYVRQLLVDSYDQKWMICRVTASNPPNPYYMYVFDEKNPPGQQVRGLKSGTGSGNLPGNAVFSMAEDLDGEVWIGTDDGIAIFYSPEGVLTGQGEEREAVRPLVDFDGYVQYLLETETVRAIAVDGNNRKWIGTERAGVFLLSEDGTEQLLHFTEDNSPLLSNTVTDLAINGETGDVYMATARGLVAYKGTATEPDDENSDVYAYPNPVRPGYTGPIAIKGMVGNASVKITDVNGNLIYETRAEGGQAVWNGYDFDGDRARSGVYLVFISNDDGSETMVTKILFVN